MKKPVFCPPDKLDIDPLKFVIASLEEAIEIIAWQNPKKNILHLSAQFGCQNLIKSYLRNLDINEKDQELMEEKTPLHYAIESRNFTIAIYLIEHGADLSATDYFNQTPAHYIAKFCYQIAEFEKINRPEIDWNYPDDATYTPLMMVNDPEIARRIIAAGGNINLVDCDGNNVLYHAAVSLNVPMVKSWLKNYPALKVPAASKWLKRSDVNFHLVGIGLGESEKNRLIEEIDQLLK